jgi:hypothetical protein
MPFAQGAVIECAPVQVVGRHELPDLESTSIAGHVLLWGEDNQDWAIAFGYATLYNHSYQPAAYCIKRLHDSSLMMVALRDIAAGEEITVNYNGDPEDWSAVGFDVVDGW